MTQNIKITDHLNNSMWPFKEIKTQRQFSIITILIAGAILLLHPYFPSIDMAYILSVISGTIGLIYMFEGGTNAPI